MIFRCRGVNPLCNWEFGYFFDMAIYGSGQKLLCLASEAWEACSLPHDGHGRSWGSTCLGGVDENSGYINLVFLELTKQFSPLENCSASMLSCLRWQIKGDYSAWKC